MSEHNFDHVERCIEVIRRGGMIILVDDKDRENEGDLVVGAEARSEEHTSELQSRYVISYAVFCLKKKK